MYARGRAWAWTRGLGRRGLWFRGGRAVRCGFFRRRRSGNGHGRPAVEREADPALRVLGDRAKLARALAEVGGEGAERGGFLAEPAEPGLAGEPGEEQGAERPRRRRAARRGALGHVVGERAPAGRRRPARDRGETLGDHAGGECEAHHLGEPGGVLGGGEAGQHACLARAERRDRAGEGLPSQRRPRLTPRACGVAPESAEHRAVGRLELRAGQGCEAPQRLDPLALRRREHVGGPGRLRAAPCLASEDAHEPHPLRRAGRPRGRARKRIKSLRFQRVDGSPGGATACALPSRPAPRTRRPASCGRGPGSQPFPSPPRTYTLVNDNWIFRQGRVLGWARGYRIRMMSEPSAPDRSHKTEGRGRRFRVTPGLLIVGV